MAGQAGKRARRQVDGPAGHPAGLLAGWPTGLEAGGLASMQVDQLVSRQAGRNGVRWASWLAGMETGRSAGWWEDRW